MKIKVEIEDTEAMQMLGMLAAIKDDLEKTNCSNVLLSAGVEALYDRIFKAMLTQVPFDRAQELCKD